MPYFVAIFSTNDDGKFSALYLTEDGTFLPDASSTKIYHHINDVPSFNPWSEEDENKLIIEFEREK